MLGPFATTSRLTPIHQMSLAVLSRAPAHRCPRQRQRRRQRQRQRVTEGTAMAPWNGPNERRRSNFGRDDVERCEVYAQTPLVRLVAVDLLYNILYTTNRSNRFSWGISLRQC